MDTEFNKWLIQLDELAKKEGHSAVSYSEETGGPETWRWYFDDGFSPETAYHEDMEHA